VCFANWQTPNQWLLIRTQICREGGSVSTATIRNHSYWQTDFDSTTFFGQSDEFAWGNISVDLRKDILWNGNTSGLSKIASFISIISK
jgi:hypothetical protein